MKHTFLTLARPCLAVMLLLPFLSLLGCGNDDGTPPSDPAYYKGEMKPKDTTAGPQGE